MTETNRYAFQTGSKTRCFTSLERAEIAARRECAKAGEPITVECIHANRGRAELIMYVCRDAFYRVWSDLCPAGAKLL